MKIYPLEPLPLYTVVKNAGQSWSLHWGSGDPKVTGVVRGLSVAYSKEGMELNCKVQYVSREEAQRVADELNRLYCQHDYAVCHILYEGVQTVVNENFT